MDNSGRPKMGNMKKVTSQIPTVLEKKSTEKLTANTLWLCQNSY